MSRLVGTRTFNEIGVKDFSFLWKALQHEKMMEYYGEDKTVKLTDLKISGDEFQQEAHIFVEVYNTEDGQFISRDVLTIMRDSCDRYEGWIYPRKNMIEHRILIDWLFFIGVLPRIDFVSML